LVLTELRDLIQIQSEALERGIKSNPKTPFHLNYDKITNQGTCSSLNVRATSRFYIVRPFRFERNHLVVLRVRGVWRGCVFCKLKRNNVRKTRTHLLLNMYAHAPTNIHTHSRPHSNPHPHPPNPTHPHTHNTHTHTQEARATRWIVTPKDSRNG